MPVMSAGGLLSDLESWTRYEDEWNETLCKYGAHEFHMKNFAHSTGEYELWRGDEAKRISFIQALARTISTTTLHSVTCTVDTEAFGRVNRRFPLLEHFGSIYAHLNLSVITTGMELVHRRAVPRPPQLDLCGG